MEEDTVDVTETGEEKTSPVTVAPQKPVDTRHFKVVLKIRDEGTVELAPEIWKRCSTIKNMLEDVVTEDEVVEIPINDGTKADYEAMVAFHQKIPLLSEDEATAEAQVNEMALKDYETTSDQDMGNWALAASFIGHKLWMAYLAAMLAEFLLPKEKEPNCKLIAKLFKMDTGRDMTQQDFDAMLEKSAWAKHLKPMLTFA